MSYSMNIVKKRIIRLFEYYRKKSRNLFEYYKMGITKKKNFSKFSFTKELQIVANITKGGIRERKRVVATQEKLF